MFDEELKLSTTENTATYIQLSTINNKKENNLFPDKIGTDRNLFYFFKWNKESNQRELLPIDHLSGYLYRCDIWEQTPERLAKRQPQEASVELHYFDIEGSLQRTVIKFIWDSKIGKLLASKLIGATNHQWITIKVSSYGKVDWATKERINDPITKKQVKEPTIMVYEYEGTNPISLPKLIGDAYKNETNKQPENYIVLPEKIYELDDNGNPVLNQQGTKNELAKSKIARNSVYEEAFVSFKSLLELWVVEKPFVFNMQPSVARQSTKVVIANPEPATHFEATNFDPADVSLGDYEDTLIESVGVTMPF